MTEKVNESLQQIECGFTNTSNVPLHDEDEDVSLSAEPEPENAEKRAMRVWLLMQECISNHIILTNIMNHLDWREKLRCKLVCREWYHQWSMYHANLRSYDFAVGRCGCGHEGTPDDQLELYVSKVPMQTPPMFAIGFYNTFSDQRICCDDFPSAPYNPPCVPEHHITEVVHALMLPERSCLLAVHAWDLIYMPRSTSRTFQHTIQDTIVNDIDLVGLYLPMMPNVNYHTLKYRTELTVQEDVYSAVDDICATDLIKGVIVFVNMKFQLRNGNLAFLNYFKSKQPDIPYALGGCVTRNVEAVYRDTMIDEDVRVTMGVFSVPKTPQPVPGPSCHFNMHSLVIDSDVYNEAATKNRIQTFAENISELQFSAAIKLSHFEREISHIVEQNLFRAAFPRTSLIGCYGVQEIGFNHTDIGALPTERTNMPTDAPAASELEFTHRGSTVFIYFTWGKHRTSSGAEA